MVIHFFPQINAFRQFTENPQVAICLVFAAPYRAAVVFNGLEEMREHDSEKANLNVKDDGSQSSVYSSKCTAPVIRSR